MVALSVALGLTSILGFLGFIAWLKHQNQPVNPHVAQLQADVADLAGKVSDYAKAIASDMETLKGRLATMEVATALRGKR